MSQRAYPRLSAQPVDPQVTGRAPQPLTSCGGHTYLRRRMYQPTTNTTRTDSTNAQTVVVAS